MNWDPYVPVAERRAKAAKKMQQLRKKGQLIEPIEIQGRTIVNTFWGKAWCEHLESFCDEDNRLPRGRTYVRNGSVCHLEIKEGNIKAIVSGSSLYHISIAIKPLVRNKWDSIKSSCTGKISSLLDLLSGKLSSGVMEQVCHPEKGLFPGAQELSLHCDCPDSAIMCKHIAATLYGVGARLDADPAKLFTLRGVNFEELVDINQAVLDVTSTQSGLRKRLDDSALTGLFDFTTTEETVSFPKNVTGVMVFEKRSALQLSKSAFARLVGVNTTSITCWESKKNQIIALQPSSLQKLQAIW